MRKLWLALLVIVLAVTFWVPSFAARIHAPRQTGLYMWSDENNDYIPIDLIVAGVVRSQNELFRRVNHIEQRIKILELD